MILWPNGSTTRPHVSSPYGPRKAPVAGASKMHRGTDFTGFALVRSIAPGVVVAVGTPAGWAGGGRQVWVQHDGFLTRSLHLKNVPAVRVGDNIPAGRILGIMGRTGTASGVHLHLEVITRGAQTDPVPFITTRLTSSGGNTPTPIREEPDMRFIKAAVDGITRYALVTLGKGQETLDVAQANLWAQTFGDARTVTPAAYNEAVNNVARL